MADVTISGLGSQAPTSNDVFPFSTTGVTPSTYKATLAQIKTALAIPATQIQSDWTQANTGALDYIKNKPTIPTAVSQLTNDSGYIARTQRSQVTASNQTSILFTGIPSTAKRITVMWTSLGTNGGTNVMLRVGTSGGIVAADYIGGMVQTGNGTGSSGSSTGMIIGGISPSESRTGTITINNLSGNTWIGTGLNISSDGASIFYSIVSRISLAQALDRVSVTSVNGTDKFTSGSVNIMYE